MGEQSSTDSTPISTKIFRRPAKSPALIIARCGYVWLPMGRPRGADNATEGAPEYAAAHTPAAVCMNARRDMPGRDFSLMRPVYSHDFARRTCHDHRQSPNVPR